MVRISIDKNAAAGQPDNFEVHRQHRGHFRLKRLLDALAELGRVHAGRHLVDDDQHFRDFQPAGQLGRHRRALKILAVRPHHQQQLVGNRDRQQRLFVHARMRVDEQVIEPQVGTSR